jgi:hypothetical protein
LWGFRNISGSVAVELRTVFVLSWFDSKIKEKGDTLMTEKDPGSYEGADIRDRLSSGNLSDDDIKKIVALLDREKSGGDLGTIGGRPIVARLPNGMDVVK